MFNSESIPTKFQNIYWQKTLELGLIWTTRIQMVALAWKLCKEPLPVLKYRNYNQIFSL